MMSATLLKIPIVGRSKDLFSALQDYFFAILWIATQQNAICVSNGKINYIHILKLSST